MPKVNRCSTCDAPIPSDAPGGRCVACLLASGLGPVDSFEALEPASLIPILLKPASSLAVKFHSFGDYELLAEVARDRFTVTFRARQLSSNRIIALRFVAPGWLTTSESVSRFQIESQPAARLNHPHIVPTHEIGEHQGQPYASLAWMAGGTLAEILATRAALGDTEISRSGFASSILSSPASIAKFLTQIARAIQYAHEQGIVHGNLRSGDISFDLQGQPYLANLGLAQLLATGELKPSLTFARDNYSLGEILKEVLNHHGSFPRETSSQTPSPTPSQASPTVLGSNPTRGHGLEMICLKCLEIDPSQRYPSVAAFADALERWSCVSAIGSPKPGPSLARGSRPLR